jgi:ribosomal protein S18 acetylase RimI-like enzyme
MSARRSDATPAVACAAARRLEELALNASASFQSLVYDGWLLGYRRGPTKRLRCVNPFYPSTLPLAQKIEHCAGFYASVGLPAIFRLLPFSQPPELDGLLERSGWARFDHTQVVRTELDGIAGAAPSFGRVVVLPVPEWERKAAPVLDVPADIVAQDIERARNYPLPQAGAIVELDGQVVACGLVKLEADHAGLFAISTAEAFRGRGFGRAIVATLLAEAKRRGALIAYLQVTKDNAAANALYESFGFIPVYDYWYRAREGEQR